jgi:hypothetical protein
MCTYAQGISISQHDFGKQILWGPVNHILGLQIYVREFLQHARTDGKKYRNEITNVLEGSELCQKNELHCPETVSHMD